MKLDIHSRIQGEHRGMHNERTKLGGTAINWTQQN